MNLFGLLAESARSHGDKTAFHVASTSETVTYGALLEEASRISAELARRGVRSGDRIALGMHNVPQFASAYFGILGADAVVVPLNVMLTERETRAILADSGAKGVLCAPPYEDLVRAAAEGTSVEAVLGIESWAEFEAADNPPDPKATEEDLAVVAYTSGTTGDPKGAMLTHGNLLANLRQQMAIPEAHVTQDDVLFLALPLFHIFGLNVTLGLTVLNAATGILIERFEPIDALRLIQEHRVTILFGAPTMYSAWVNTPGADQYDLSSVRFAVSGAAPLASDVLKSFKEIFNVDIFEGYGLTETAPTLWSNRMTLEPRPGSVGMPLPEVEFRLIGENGEEVEVGDPGEIVVRGPNVFKGYWGREAETAAAFVDGWFRTGDVGVLDEEGYLYLVDRKRDLIIVSGFNVYPSEVEEALLASHKVEEAAVIGVPHPYTGEAVKAFVVLRQGETATEAELIADAETRLARFKCPQSIDIVDELPHLLTGKVLRRALRSESARGHPAA